LNRSMRLLFEQIRFHSILSKKQPESTPHPQGNKIKRLHRQLFYFGSLFLASLKPINNQKPSYSNLTALADIVPSNRPCTHPCGKAANRVKSCQIISLSTP